MASSAAPTSGRDYGGRSAAARRQRRREQLLVAGLELFGTRGIAATRIDDVCAEAGLTKRYFYESFGGLGELVDAVLADIVNRLASLVVPLLPGAHGDPRPAFSAFVGAMMDDPRLIRLLVVETNYGELVHLRQSLVDTAVATWAGTSPATAMDTRVLGYAFTGAAGEIAVASLTGRLDLTPEQMTDQLVDIYRRLTAEPYEGHGL